MNLTRTVIRRGMVIDGSGLPARRADLALRGGIIELVGDIPREPNDMDVDASGRYLLPGFIDAHSHADSTIFEDAVQRSLLKQGVTSIIIGQDGISYAPGDGGYATDYFGTLLGSHPSYQGGGVADLFATYDATTRVNVGYLVPAGSIRHEAMGFADRKPSPIELTAMIDMVYSGMKAGALGISTGLDYVPGRFADTAEIIALCRPVARAGGLYVTHMRGGYETNASIGMDEVGVVAATTGVSVHVSHYHGPAEVLLPLIEGLRQRGLSVTFDAYPYRRGASLLAMFSLPPWLLSGTGHDVAQSMTSPTLRAALLADWFPLLGGNPSLGPKWPEMISLAHIGSSSYGWACGLTLAEAADRVGLDPATFTIDVLVASDLQVSVVVELPDQRPYDDLARLFTHPAHIAGSDGFFVGANPHPRAWGTFAKYLRVFVRTRGDYTWPEAAVHLATRTAQRFGLVDRGMLRPGFAADIVLVDPLMAGDLADYANPRVESQGIDDVFVNGTQVLAGGELTEALPGHGLRRSAASR